VNTQPHRVLPLAHFGAISGVCNGGVAWTDHHGACEKSGSTQQRSTMHLLLVAGKAHHRSGTFHSRHIGVGKEKLYI
jgi:hypothetical protein